MAAAVATEPLIQPEVPLAHGAPVPEPPRSSSSGRRSKKGASVRVVIDHSDDDDRVLSAGSGGCRGSQDGGATTSCSDFSGSDNERPKRVGAAKRRAAICGACGKAGAGFRCGRCRAVLYCGRDCQRLHWDAGHAQECTRCAKDAMWADLDIVALVFAWLPARAASRAMVVSPVWRRYGPYLLQVARWRGHPASRRLRSRPYGAASWKNLHLAETLLLAEDFQYRGRGRWQLVYPGKECEKVPALAPTAAISADGSLSALEDEAPDAPQMAALLLHRLRHGCRPRHLRVRFRCRPRTPGAVRSMAYVALASSEECLVRQPLSPETMTDYVAVAFCGWTAGAVRGRGRRVTGLLGSEATRPVVDDTAPTDVVELDITFAWNGRAECSRSSSAAPEPSAIVHLQIGAFGRARAVAFGDEVRCLALGVGSGSTAEFLEVTLA
eukprot:TRINITY_DN62925_c0_g1_i1.p1 TRINITY_DN62925_c0_g1~~TRINITY_DN62925_c0_g1_i1.p1  ORF type:complete len:452 (+),score=58.01 TRINITY_DN62925_c0_g1_i1:41-1357(+)